MSGLSLNTTLRLSSGTWELTMVAQAVLLKHWHSCSCSAGWTMPLLGFGVYQNYTTKESVLEAFKAGYR